MEDRTSGARLRPLASLALTLGLATTLSLAAFAQQPQHGTQGGSHAAASHTTGGHTATSHASYHTTHVTHAATHTTYTATHTTHTVHTTHTTTSHYHTTTTHYTTTTSHHVTTTRRATTTHAGLSGGSVTGHYHSSVTHYTSYRSSHVVRTSYGGTRLRSTGFVHSLSSYHAAHYGGVSVNVSYALHPGGYPGAHWMYYGGHRWYDGYWYNYWGNQPWLWWGGYYGFWIDLDGIQVFVYESSPGECMFWNGYAWTPWYDPPYTPYYCPY